MRFLYTAVAALSAAVVSAQSTNNAISVPAGQSTLDVTAGQPLTLDWTNPSSGTVTIKLVQQPITPDSGVVLASGVPASDGTATVDIPAAADVNSFQYTIEIIDDSNENNINFSPNFGIQGATGTATGSQTGSLTASSTGTASSGTSSGTSSATGSVTSSGTASTTATGSTMSSGSTSSGSTSSGSTSSGSSSPSSTASTTSSSQSSTTSSSEPTQNTPAPNSNGNAASGLQVQGGLLAMAVGLVAFV